MCLIFLFFLAVIAVSLHLRHCLVLSARRRLAALVSLKTKVWLAAVLLRSPAVVVRRLLLWRRRSQLMTICCEVLRPVSNVQLVSSHGVCCYNYGIDLKNRWVNVVTKACCSTTSDLTRMYDDLQHYIRSYTYVRWSAALHQILHVCTMICSTTSDLTRMYDDLQHYIRSYTYVRWSAALHQILHVCTMICSTTSDLTRMYDDLQHYIRSYTYVRWSAALHQILHVCTMICSTTSDLTRMYDDLHSLCGCVHVLASPSSSVVCFVFLPHRFSPVTEEDSAFIFLSEVRFSVSCCCSAAHSYLDVYSSIFK